MREKYNKINRLSNILDYMTKYTGGSIRHKGIRMADIQEALFDLRHDSFDVINYIFDTLSPCCEEHCAECSFEKCKRLFPMNYSLGSEVMLKHKRGRYKITNIDRVDGTYTCVAMNKDCEFQVSPSIKGEDIKKIYKIKKEKQDD